MKKIFVYNASPRGENSNTLKYILKVLDRVKELVNCEFKIDIFHPQNSKINKCLGCEQCFYTGNCLLDKTDDMNIIKRKMLESNFIIFSSPIYSINVSGDMKIFFDRIASFAHLVHLRGKCGICILTSCGNGVYHSLNYMNSIMNFLGIDVIDKYNVTDYSKTHLMMDENYMVDKINDTAEKIADYITEKTCAKSNESLEKIFYNMKNYMRLLKDYPTYEYTYWKENGLFEFDKYQDLLDFEKSKKDKIYPYENIRIAGK